MKKIIFPLALFTGLAGAAQAQTGLKLGLKGGFSNSAFAGQDSRDWDYKEGFTAGGVLNYSFTDNLSVQSELLYSQKGARRDDAFYLKGTTLIADGRAKSRLGYLDLPVLVKINAGQEGRGLFMELGPQVSFLVSQRSFIEDADGKKVGSFVVAADGASKVLVGYVVGVGYQLAGGLGFGARYTSDFSRAYQGPGPITTVPPSATPTTVPGNPNLHNSVFQVQVHYLFSRQ